jgi:hypothetical protein
MLIGARADGALTALHPVDVEDEEAAGVFARAGKRALTGIDASVLAAIFVGDLEHAASDNVDGLSSNNGSGSSS